MASLDLLPRRRRYRSGYSRQAGSGTPLNRMTPQPAVAHESAPSRVYMMSSLHCCMRYLRPSG